VLAMQNPDNDSHLTSFGSSSVCKSARLCTYASTHLSVGSRPC